MTTAVLDARVLVLNKNWYPVNVTQACKAIHMAWKERALCLDTDTGATYDWESWVENWSDASALAKSGVKHFTISGFVVRVPEVVICREYGGIADRASRRIPKFSRANLFRRDKNMCQYCGQKFPTEEFQMEHVIPRSQGGKTTWQNIVLACGKCNAKKDNKTPIQAGMRLIRPPRIPKADEVVLPAIERLKRRVGKRFPQTWEKFLGHKSVDSMVSDMYWSAELKD